VASLGGNGGGEGVERGIQGGRGGAFLFGAQVPLELKAVRNLDKYYGRFGKRRK